MGAISGIQRVLDGQIEWSYHLPHSCQLSQYDTYQRIFEHASQQLVFPFIYFLFCPSLFEGV